MNEKYYIKDIDNKIAKKMIVENHYSKKFSKSSVALGLFQNGDDKLIGCLTYGDPVGSNVCSSISPHISQGEVFELTRLWIEDDTPKNTESWFIGQSFKWLRENKPKIKVLISYADPAAGHGGIIYRATNWLYCPTGQKAGDFNVSFDGKKFIHVRTLENEYGGLGLKNMKEKLPRPFWIKKNSTKVRYIYIITSNKKEKKKIMNTLVYKSNEYPKTIETVNNPIIKVE